MDGGDRRNLFDRWAPNYDESVQTLAGAESFPFAGYERVLDAICDRCSAGAGMRVLELGTGTGNLALRLYERGCRVWAADSSPSMLDAAREKLPEAVLIQADLASEWPGSMDGPFDRVVSAYVLHEFDLSTKIEVVREAVRRLSSGGRIVIGDVAFSTRREHDLARERWRDCWDCGEHYWIADEAIEAANRAGLAAGWTSLSVCAGVLVFEPSDGRATRRDRAATPGLQ